MEREETKKLMMVICTTFPNFRPNNLSQTVDIWHEVLKDYDFRLMSGALKAFIISDRSGFAPTIGQLIALIQDVEYKDDLNEIQAWSMVSKGIRDSNYHAEEHFNAFPDLIKKCVGSPSQLRAWGQSDINAIETVIQSNFIKTYRSEVQRQKSMARMGIDVSAAIEQKSHIGLEVK